MSAQDYRVNHRIRVPEVRLIDENGEQVGVVDTNDAKRRAQDADLDLVEVSPQARPPVCKIMDFGKFKYQQRKKEKKGGPKHVSLLKELRVRPAIDDHDLSYRLDNGRRFLEAGHKVQVVCIFRGRQMAHPEHGFDVMRKVADALADVCKVESAPRMVGRRMTMLLSHRASEVKKPGPGKPQAASGKAPGKKPPAAAKPPAATKPPAAAKPPAATKPPAVTKPPTAAKPPAATKPPAVEPSEPSASSESPGAPGTSASPASSGT